MVKVNVYVASFLLLCYLVKYILLLNNLKGNAGSKYCHAIIWYKVSMHLDLVGFKTQKTQIQLWQMKCDINSATTMFDLSVS